MVSHRHVIQTSGGITSAAAALRVIEKHGRDDVTLLFADTLVEDEDLYRFLAEFSAHVGIPITRVADGRTPQQVNRDKRWVGNDRIAPCSHLLKQKPCRDWLKANCDPDNTTLYIGIDWTTKDANRIPSIRRGWAPWYVEFPLLEEPLISKDGWFTYFEQQLGIAKSRLYDMGFEHNNCGGACVRGGQGQWARLSKVFPDRYASWENHEREMSVLLGVEGDGFVMTKPATVLRSRTGGTARPLPLVELRRRVEETDRIRAAQPFQLALFDEFDWGGCSCFTADNFESGTEQ